MKSLKLAAIVICCCMLVNCAKPKQQIQEVKPRDPLALSEFVYKTLSFVIETQENLDQSLAVLEELERKTDLNSYEYAMLLNVKGIVYAAHEKYGEALAAYELSMQQPDVLFVSSKESFFSAAKLAQRALPSSEALERIQTYMTYFEEPSADMYKVLGYAFYRARRYTSAIRAFEQGFAQDSEQAKIKDFKWLESLSKAYHKVGDVANKIRVERQLSEVNKLRREQTTEINPIKQVAPVYPANAIQNGIEGSVILEFTVTRIGTVKDIIIIESQPPGVFDDAAIDAVREFKYKPNTKDGKPIEVYDVRSKLTFNLD